jgi:hypothetical protein
MPISLVIEAGADVKQPSRGSEADVRYLMAPTTRILGATFLMRRAALSGRCDDAAAAEASITFTGSPIQCFANL